MQQNPINFSDPFGHYTQAISACARNLRACTAAVMATAAAINNIFNPVKSKTRTCDDDDGNDDCKDKLSPWEIEKMKKLGPEFHPHSIKKDYGAGFDLYKCKNGDIVIRMKPGIGPNHPTGLNVNMFR